MSSVIPLHDCPRYPCPICTSSRMTPGHYTYTPAVQQGWQCPVCKTVMSPSMVTCIRCPSVPITTTGAGT
jgi:hypothetical protein